MPKKKTHDDFLKDVKNKFGRKFSILSEYKNANTKIKIQCNECKSVYMVKPASFIRQKHGCQSCYFRNQHSLSERDFKEKFYCLVKDEYTLICPPKDSRDKMTVLHNECGYEYKVDYCSFMFANKRCRKCNGTLKQTPKEFKEWFEKEVKEEYLLLSEYQSNTKKIKVRHVKCGHDYWVVARSFKNNGARCPKCNSSKGEQYISKFLNENNILFEPQKRFKDFKNKNTLPFDFYLPEYNILIEYQGIQHYKPIKAFGGKQSFENTKENDLIKYKYCLLKDIELIYVKYDDNIEEELLKLKRKLCQS